MSTFLVRGARVLTMNDALHVLDGDVLVQGGVIAAVGPDLTAPPGVAVIDGADHYLMPGLIQPHIHLCQTLFRHEAEGRPLLAWLRERIWPLEGAHTPESLARSCELGLAELLLSGTTTLLDMGTVHHQDAVFETAAAWGVRGAFGKAMMDVGEGVPATLRESTQRSLDESLRLGRTWHGADNDRLRYAFAPRFVLSCSAALQQEVGRLSAAEGYLVHTHASEHREEVALIERLHGMRNVHLLHSYGLCSPRSVFAHGVQLDADERRILRDTGTSICHCPSSNLKLGSGIADVLTLLREGVNVAIGADGAPCNNGLDAFVEMRLAHLLQGPKHGAGALTPVEVLRLATRGGAKALGWEERVGSLEPGKDADMVLLRRNDPRLGLGSDPYTEIVCAGTRDLVRRVWVRGRLLVDEGTLVQHDLDGLLHSGRRALDETLRRAGLAA